MLDFIYYPISAVLWFWHKVFGFVLGPDSGLSWA
ncbi:MAG: membrane protein insertase YidC, partial [Corynebacterium sp.]|nr:membrane protein insertase YidC [Corynebacterium sp.]